MSHYFWARFVGSQDALAAALSFVVGGSQWYLEIKRNPEPTWNAGYVFIGSVACVRYMGLATAFHLRHVTIGDEGKVSQVGHERVVFLFSISKFKFNVNFSEARVQARRSEERPGCPTLSACKHTLWQMMSPTPKSKPLFMLLQTKNILSALRLGQPCQASR